jgi:hypothetical protein
VIGLAVQSSSWDGRQVFQASTSKSGERYLVHYYIRKDEAERVNRMMNDLSEDEWEVAVGLAEGGWYGSVYDLFEAAKGLA